MAEALEASLDYLVDSTDALLDKTIAKKNLDIKKLKDEEKSRVFSLLDQLRLCINRFDTVIESGKVIQEFLFQRSIAPLIQSLEHV